MILRWPLPLILTIFFANASFAFDRISCDGKLDTWSVWNGHGKKNKVLYKDRPQFELPEPEVPLLIIKDAGGKSVATVYPWNGIDMIQSDSTKKLSFTTDKMTWFELTIAGKPSRRLYCKLTF